MAVYSRTLTTGAIVSLLCLVLLNLFTIHYIVNQSVTHQDNDNLNRLQKSPVSLSVQTMNQQKSSNSLSEDMKIPRIVHLSWKNTMIPDDNVKWMKRWSETNPDWEVWFWTDESAKNFITEKYPHLLDVYNRYRTAIFKADAMRYILLYEYGGIWADLDVEPLRSLEPLREKYSCILSQESEVHAKVGWHTPQLICNAFMATRKRHPFFKFLIGMLEVNQKDNHPVAATGPMMLTRMYRAYQPLFEKLGDSKLANEVHIASVNMFLPTIDSLAMDNLRKRCRDHSIGDDKLYLCEKYLDPKFKNGPTAESFTDHHWWHSWLGKQDYQKFQNISSIIPKVVFPEKRGKF